MNGESKSDIKNYLIVQGDLSNTAKEINVNVVGLLTVFL